MAPAYRRCTACGQAQPATRRFCIGCGGATLAQHPARGDGTVHTFTTVHRAPSAAFRALVPYTLALVDMDEGFRLLLPIHMAGEPAIGQRIRMTADAAGQPVAVPA